MSTIADSGSAGRRRSSLWKLVSGAMIGSLLLAGWSTRAARAIISVTVRYVAPGGLTSGACDSWVNACDLPYALGIAVATDQLWVKQGVYKPTTNPLQVSASFNIPSGVQVYGGFAGTESSLGSRNWTTNVTVLSGDIDSNDAHAGTTNIDISPTDIAGSNSYHVVRMDGTTSAVDTTTVLDGFTITGGEANGTSVDAQGGGLYCNGGGPGSMCSPTLAHLRFSANVAIDLGGGLYDNGALGVSSPSLSDVTFYANRATNGGAGMYDSGTGGVSSPSLLRVTFQINEVTDSLGKGGGMFNDGSSGGLSSPNLTEVTFAGNVAPWGGGGLYSHADGGTSNPVLTNSTFSANGSAGAGGGMTTYCQNSGVCNATLTDSTFHDNNAVDGGALANMATNSAITNVGVINVTLSGNVASNDGGGIFSVGGPVFPYNSTVTVTLINDILWGDFAPNGPEIFKQGAPGMYFKASVVQGSGGSGATWDVSLGNDLGGNLDADPILGPLQGNGGFTQSMALLAGSSAIDTGDDGSCPLTDQRGAARPRGPHCDIGAYEKIPAVASFSSGYRTDLGVFRPSTGGWFVKNVFATSFGLSGDDPLPYDFNGDGKSDVAVYRPSNASWYVQGQFSTFYGMAGDVPVPGDYDGNRVADLAVYRPTTSAWYVKNQFATIYGLPGDIPVPGDYDGDGKTDVAVFRPSTSAWYVKGQFSTIFGLPGDIPIPGDYNGDGITDLAVYRPSTSAWYVRGLFAAVFGVPGDIPVPGDYNGDGVTDIAVYRPASSGWFVNGQLSTIYGLTGDYPLPAPDTNADGDPYQ